MPGVSGVPKEGGAGRLREPPSRRGSEPRPRTGRKEQQDVPGAELWEEGRDQCV